MNQLLEISGRMDSAGYDRPVKPSLPSHTVITAEKLTNLKFDLQTLQSFWSNKNILNNALISVYYSRVIPKSLRIKRFLSASGEDSNQYVRGVRFASQGEYKKHIITYYVAKDMFDTYLNRIDAIIEIFNAHFGGCMDTEKFDSIDGRIKSGEIQLRGVSKSLFKQLVLDLSNIDKFDVFQIDDPNNSGDSKYYITFFDVDEGISPLMQKLGIRNIDYEVFSENTIYANSEAVLLRIKESASYLISMAMPDLASYTTRQENSVMQNINFLHDTPSPTNEPVIGVIDTLFDESVYFNEWVEYHDCLSDDIPREAKDYCHGTEVSSVIVDGGRINTGWDDDCGMFRVRHFGVAKDGPNSSFEIIRKIRRIVAENRDIHVWNISLGSDFEIGDNYVSPEAEALDELQYKYEDIVFVVAGTNDNRGGKNNVQMKIGAPADSINSIVVNAVGQEGKIASYSRTGKVLSFFIKPDVCAFGGDLDGRINVCSTTGVKFAMGTSYAAPWVSRKMCYLMDKMGLSREVAKALIIDSASGWGRIHDEEVRGRGVVPQKIRDIIMGGKDEIKFFVTGRAESYYTYTYNLPVPMSSDEKFPFYARAVLCYFPKCIRSQGVDYTNTELDLQIGRLKGDRSIMSINKNVQNDPENHTTEEKARELYRKWDNVKVVADEIKTQKRHRKNYTGNNFWGIKILNKNRVDGHRNLKFGLVVTLKEMDGKNRQREFIELCNINGWIVNKIDIDARLEVYESSEEEIELDA